MDDRLSRIDDRLREVDEAIGRLCARVTALERGAAAAEAPTSPAPVRVREGAIASESHASADTSVLPLLTLVGRTFLVFGGAYLLRALTDSGRLPPAWGIIIGFAYASVWMGAADRAAIRRPASGLFHGLAGLVIGCPLLLEASTRFGVLSPAGAAALLVGLTSVAMAVAWHRELQSLAGIASIAGSVTAVVLGITTGRVLPFALAAIAIGVMAESVGALRGWRWPARMPALVANLLVLDLIARAHALIPLESVPAAFAAALLLAAFQMLVVTNATIAKRDDVSMIDITQSLTALLIGLGGAVSLARVIGPVATSALGTALLALGIGGYIVVQSRATQWSTRANVVLTSLAAVVLTVGGVAHLSGSLRDFVFGAAAVMLLSLGTRTGRAWLIGQGALFAVMLAMTSRLIQLSADAWIGGAMAVSMPAAAIVAIGIVLAGGVILPGFAWARSRAASVSAFVLTALSAFGLGALGIRLLDALDGRLSTPGVMAAERSVVVAILAISLTALSRLRSGAGLRWLAYAAIAVGGLKLVVEDMRVSSELAIFVALAAYGVALIVTARLLSRKPEPA